MVSRLIQIATKTVKLKIAVANRSNSARCLIRYFLDVLGHSHVLPTSDHFLAQQGELLIHPLLQKSTNFEKKVQIFGAKCPRKEKRKMCEKETGCPNYRKVFVEPGPNENFRYRENLGTGIFKILDWGKLENLSVVLSWAGRLEFSMFWFPEPIYPEQNILFASPA